jgi:hypothetical protein
MPWDLSVFRNTYPGMIKRFPVVKGIIIAGTGIPGGENVVRDLRSGLYAPCSIRGTLSSQRQGEARAGQSGMWI